jgi:hypothetical protein
MSTSERELFIDWPLARMEGERKEFISRYGQEPTFLYVSPNLWVRAGSSDYAAFLVMGSLVKRDETGVLAADDFIFGPVPELHHG